MTDMIPILTCEWGSIYGDRRTRIDSPIAGYDRPKVGWRLTCGQCGWTDYVGAPVRTARKVGRDHLRYSHGVTARIEEVPTR